TTPPYPAGPEFPREPPSALMMTIAGSFTDRTPRCEPGCGHTPRSAIHRLLLRYAIGRYHACSVLTGILDSAGIEAPRPPVQHVYESAHTDSAVLDQSPVLGLGAESSLAAQQSQFPDLADLVQLDRKSTRLNSSHVS